MQNNINKLIRDNSKYYSSVFFDDRAQMEDQASKDYFSLINSEEKYNLVSGARVGDYLMIGSELFRFTDTDELIGVTRSSEGFNLEDGVVSYSGESMPSLPGRFFDQSKRLKPGKIFFSSDDGMRLKSVIYADINQRVFTLSTDDPILEEIKQAISQDQFPDLHPVLVCDPESLVFKQALVEYYFRRQIGQHDHYLLADCEIAQ